jgi:hypothetical protein
MNTSLKGRYIFSSGALHPDDAMKKILQLREPMQMIAGTSANGFSPMFLWKSDDDSYWECIENEDFSIQLRLISRDHIESQFPSINCDERVLVDW